MSTPVQDDQPVGPEDLGSSVAPEQLDLGAPPPRSLPRWASQVALVLGILVLATAAIWRFWPQPVEPLSLAELEDTYAGMVLADGTNDASVLTRQSVVETPLEVTPAECAPLMQATSANRFPDEALDGVGTYWINRSSTISLFTLRFTDAKAAAAEQARLDAALQVCVNRQVVVRRGQEAGVRAWRAEVARTHAGTSPATDLGYTLAGSDGVMAVQLMPYLNTLTWQFRYETGSAEYSTLPADQLMSSLRRQLDDIVAARPR